MEGSLREQTLDSHVNIDSLRGEFESAKEWRLRRKFIEMNYDCLPLDRLVCLSRCFVNMAMYGCSYPAAVIMDVQRRSPGILEAVHAEKKTEAKQKYYASFVKASSGPDTLSSVDASGDSTCDVKKLCPLAQAADSFPPTGRLSESRCHSHVAWAGLKTDEKPDVSGDYWGDQENTTGSLPPAESIKQSLVAVINSNSGTQSQGAFSSNLEPNGQHPKAALSKEECLAASQNETDPVLQKIRKLAREVLSLGSTNMNCKEVLHLAGSRVPVLMDFAVKEVVNKRSVNFLCCVLVERVELASGLGSSIRQAKTEACEAALKVIMMPRLEIIQDGGDKHPVLKGMELTQNRNMPRIPSSWHETGVSASDGRLTRQKKMSYKKIPHKESTSRSVKRRQHDLKTLDNFIVVEPWNTGSSGNPVNVLRQSASFSKMLLDYEFYTHGLAGTRCVVTIEGEIVADAVDSSKITAKATASAQCLKMLKACCWLLKTKQAVDSNTSISKEEIQKEIQLKSNQISSDNIGSKMLQKMGWSGGGVGKNGTGISEPVSLVSVLNRQGLGLAAECGISDDFRERMKEVIGEYATSGRQEDLAFSSEFSIEERRIIHDECRKLNLRSVSRGKGQNRYLCVSRKRSANQLFEHIMACGGETAKYKLLPPGADVTGDEDQPEFCDVE